MDASAEDPYSQRPSQYTYDLLIYMNLISLQMRVMITSVSNSDVRSKMISANSADHGPS